MLVESAFMRLRLLAFVLLAATVAPAVTIRLKNGRTIVADSARETDGRIEYNVGDDTYSIPKAVVDRIEDGGAPPPSDTAAPSGGSPGKPLPAIVPTEKLDGWSELQARIIREGHVDTEALASFDNPSDPDRAAAAYFVASTQEFEVGNPEKARQYLDRALGFMPDNPVLLTRYATVLNSMQQYAEAVQYGERASRLAPNSADAFAVLGSAYFQSDHTAQAIKAWERSLELRPNPVIAAMLDKARRESAVQSDFGEQDSSHFTLRYEGEQSSAAFRHVLVQTLESHYTTLVSDLGAEPRDTISVILYTNQAYFDVTRAPTWTGAVNDGKLRIPVEGLTSVDSELSGVLKHELTHSFVNQITRGRCPVWLNEGVAMLEQGRTSSSYGRQLGKLYAAHKNLPLNQLEGSFMNFNSNEATVAYVESLAAVEYIRDTYGMSDVDRVLERIGEGSSAEAALRATIHSGYGQLEQEIADYLKKNYGE